ncbi:serine threonine- kinase Sgk2 protein [Rutstroemia sp. NJR-2017a BBW]|nr:serine threonine- kinase Sgk2 protein [Rutstroemia sp. NJR-2017a BBW]
MKTVNMTQSKTLSAVPAVAHAHNGEVRPIGRKHPNDESILLFDDLIFCCAVVSPLGHPLDKFDTVLEFLEGCRDAIKGYRSLYFDGKILHQDVSTGNIVIPDIKRPGEPWGVLIDLDLAMELAVGPKKPREIIGTKEFMVIEVLARKPHTYRHDLESCFYVFLWIAICGGHKRLPSGSRLQRWQAGSWDDLARNKTEDMAEENFTIILSEFSPAFKSLEGLARDLCSVLFSPSPDGSLFIGTRHETEEVQRLYDEMISAFDVAANAYVSEDIYNGQDLYESDRRRTSLV